MVSKKASIAFPEDMRQALPKIVPHDSARGRGGEVDDLEDLLLQVELLRGAVVRRQREDMVRERRYEG